MATEKPTVPERANRREKPKPRERFKVVALILRQLL